MKAWLAFYPGDFWALWTLALVGQVTVLLLAALVASWALRRRPAARHALWLSALIGVIAAPLLSAVVRQAATRVKRVETTEVAESSPAIAPVPRPTAKVSRLPAPIPEIVHVERAVEVRPSAVRVDGETLAAATPASTLQPVNSWWRRLASAESLRLGFVAATVVWGAGALLFLARLLSGLRCAERLRTVSEPCDDPRVLRLAVVAAEVLRSRNRPNLLLSSEAPGPLFLGLWRPVILLPVGLPQALDDAALAAVLRHEFAHAARRDTLVGFVERLVRAIWWPHPLVWRLCRELDRSREELCDNAALQTADRTAYAETLLAVATFRSGGNLPTAGYAFLGSKRSFEARIVNLLDRRRSMTTKANLNVRMGVALAVAAAATLGAWGTGGLGAAADQANVQSPEPSQGAGDDGAQRKLKIRRETSAAVEGKPARSISDDAALFGDLDRKDLERYLSLAETNLHRAIAAETQVAKVSAAYRDGGATLDLLLDALRRRCEAAVAYHESIRKLRREVVGKQHRAAIDHESLVAQRPYYQQQVEDTRKIWVPIYAAFTKGETGSEQEAQVREQFFLAQNQLETHESAIAELAEAIRLGKDPSDGDLYPCTYNVEDLVAHPDGDVKRQLELLREMIQRMVATGSWGETGRQGSIVFFENRCLVISQTEAVHEQINSFLEQVRRLREPAAETGKAERQ